jgi:hypothetical protein
MEKSAKGLWDETDILEVHTAHINKQRLADVEEVIETLYECGVELFTLDKKDEINEVQTIGAILFKRVLTDLRVIWNLVSIGYTSQAGCVAAGLYETALAIAYILSNERAIDEIREKNGDIPWTPKELCKDYAKRSSNQNKKLYELAWRELYGTYKWLCKIKHPTLRSAIHDALSSSLEEKFVVMAAPDIREEDLPVKVMILTLAVNRTYMAMNYLQKSLNLIDNERYRSWHERQRSILERITRVYVKTMKDVQVPFNIRDEKVSKEYFTLRNKYSSEM